ncbi:MAG: hypothetical protein U1E56_01030 [Bauldia sp.]
MSSPITLLLTDDDEGIVIAKSGVPEPDAALLGWLKRECCGAYRHRCDGAFNTFFTFADAEDARRFQAAWKARSL